MPNEVPFAVSTDIAGLFKSTKVIPDVYDFALEDPNFVGVEVIAWNQPEPIFDYAQRLDQWGIPIAGIHGRTGNGFYWRHPISGIKSKAIDALLMDSPQLIRAYAGMAPYLLFHQPAVNEEVVAAMQEHPDQVFYIENHSGPKAGKAARNMTDALRSNGVKAVHMWDPGHTVAELRCTTPSLSEEGLWLRLLHEAERTVRETNQFGVHLQIDPTDPGSIPVNKVLSPRIKELAAIVQGHVHHVTIENQTSHATHGLWPFESSRPTRRVHAQRMIDRYKEVGLL